MGLQHGGQDGQILRLVIHDQDCAGRLFNPGCVLVR
jgi:hypothetical protein